LHSSCHVYFVQRAGIHQTVQKTAEVSHNNLNSIISVLAISTPSA